MISRKDSKGRILKPNEDQMKDGRYRYRYIDVNGIRRAEYSWRLVATDKPPKGKKSDLSLREKEAKITKDVEDKTDIFRAETFTVTNLVILYLSIKTMADSTYNNYLHMLHKHIEPDRLGQMKITKVKRSDIKLFYADLHNKHKFKDCTIQLYQNLLFPAFTLAVDDDLIRKNPCRNCMKEYNNNQNESSKTPLTRDEQKALMEYVRKDNIYSKYYVMIAFMLGTGCRIGEVIGMTWDDINFEKNIINVNHQIIYKKKKNATRTVHYVELPKNRQTRSIPLQSDLKDILLKYKSATYFLSKSSPVECDGYSGFVFLNSQLKLYTPNTVNRSLHLITAAYNDSVEDEEDAVQLPVFSAHVLRHTFCTRMAENGLDVKVLQKIMGHKSITITMQIYNHVSEQRIQDSIKGVASVLAV